MASQKGAVEKAREGSRGRSCISLVTTWPAPSTGWDTRRTSSTVYTVLVPCTDVPEIQPLPTSTLPPTITSLPSGSPIPTHTPTNHRHTDTTGLKIGLGIPFSIIAFVIVYELLWRKKCRRAAATNEPPRANNSHGNDPPGNSPHHGDSIPMQDIVPAGDGAPRSHVGTQGGVSSADEAARINVGTQGSNSPNGNGGTLTGGTPSSPESSGTFSSGMGVPNEGEPPIVLGPRR